jgi:hypothetical protein
LKELLEVDDNNRLSEKVFSILDSSLIFGAAIEKADEIYKLSKRQELLEEELDKSMLSLIGRKYTSLKKIRSMTNEESKDSRSQLNSGTRISRPVGSVLLESETLVENRSRTMLKEYKRMFKNYMFSTTDKCKDEDRIFMEGTCRFHMIESGCSNLSCKYEHNELWIDAHVNVILKLLLHLGPKLTSKEVMSVLKYTRIDTRSAVYKGILAALRTKGMV